MSTISKPTTDAQCPKLRHWRTIKLIAGGSQETFTEAAIRAMIYRSKPHYNSKGEWVAGNGLAAHICQPGGKGGKVLIDQIGWTSWLESWTSDAICSERKVA